MKIKMLGTAAYEAWPGMFCNCPTCAKVRKLRGKDLRTRASILVDETIKIDAGFDNFLHSVEEGVDFEKIEDIFITHSHTDHFIKEDLDLAIRCGINLYGNIEVYNIMKDFTDEEYMYKVNLINPFETIKTGDGHIVTSIKAEHSGDKVCDLNYVISFEGKTIAYLTDSGLYRDEKTWEFLKQFKFDAIISECTSGWLDFDPYYHQTFNGVCTARKRFMNMGCIKDDTPYYLTHFSHNVGLLHSEMCERAEPLGYTICYDGMDIVV